MSMTGIGEVADLAKTAINAIWPDKTEQEKAQLAAAVSLVQGQLAINQTEAASSDPLQHWRGGLGWVCAAAYAFNFVVQPLLSAACAIAGHPLTLPVLELGELSTLTLGMLGLGGLHVAERIKGAA
jgi:hypothetical protein